MKSSNQRNYEVVRAASDFCSANPSIITPGSALAELVNKLKLSVVQLDASAIAAIDGSTGFRTGTRDKQEIREEILEQLRVFRSCAEILTPSLPEIEGKFSAPRTSSCVALLHTAQAVNEDLPAFKPAMMQCEMPEDFDAKFGTLVQEFEKAIDRQRSSRAGRVGGNASLKAVGIQGYALVRKLDAIFRMKLRTQPSLLAQWKNVARRERPAAKKANAVTV